MSPLVALVSLALRALIRTYQVAVSPLLGPACRFAPTCSEFTREAIERHGPWAGLWLGARRLARCHPFGRGGHDPVPGVLERRHASAERRANRVVATPSPAALRSR